MLQSHTVQLSGVFDDPGAVLRLVAARAPFESVTLVDADSGGTGPRFSCSVEDHRVLYNRNWIAAAKEAFSASIVRPLQCRLDLAGPEEASSPELDLPAFRGFCAGPTPRLPVWLLRTMRDSGLFSAFLMPVATGLAWFYSGSGGEHEYWPDGITAPSQLIKPAFWNVGSMTDHALVWHRTRASGEPSERARLCGASMLHSQLHCLGNDGWAIRSGSDVVAWLAPHQLRMSFSWKAYVFRDQAHLRSFNDRTLDLTVAEVVRMFDADLHARGVEAASPQDPFSDARWRATLERVYAPVLPL